jgi:A118 family predicted phage portal protein
LELEFDQPEAKAFVDKVLADNNFKVNASQLFELMEALGTCSLVTNFDGEKIVIDYIHGDLIFPLKWDNGKVIECAFAIVGGDNEETAYHSIINEPSDDRHEFV